MIPRLAIVVTHPIQYYAPIFQKLALRKKVDIHVFHSQPRKDEVFDEGFGQKINWDIPLLNGYNYSYRKPGEKSKQLIRKIQAYHPDYLLVFGWSPQGHLNTMRYFKNKIPVWFRGDSTLLDEQLGLRHIVRRLWLTWVYRHIDKAFYVGTQNKRYFLAHRVKERQLFFAPHAIDNARFFDNLQCDYEMKAGKWRNKLKIAPDEMVILYAGKLERKKAPDLLLRAILDLNKEESVSLRLVFAGSGNMEKELKTLGAGKDFIHFIGFQNQSQMPIVYRLGNIFCLPSSGPGETWGLAINEAMACGKPVITSDKVGCSTDLVKNKQYGKCFGANDLADCKKAILEMVERVKQNPKLGETAKAAIMAWSFESIVESIENQVELFESKKQ